MRKTNYEFVKTDLAECKQYTISLVEQILGVTVQPGSPLMLLCSVFATILTYLLGKINHAGNQNLPSGAEGENLDRLAEELYFVTRPEAKGATCTVEFKISEAQEEAIRIPAGTRVTDASKTLYWATQRDEYISPGSDTITLPVVCQTVGTDGNGWEPGQISDLVDIFPYYASCKNTTTSGGGSDVMTDDEFYNFMVSSTDSHSTAGATGGYEYWARTASTEIAGVLANSPEPGKVKIYTLMNDGTPAGEEIKKAVLAACSPKAVRPLTDHVECGDPTTVEYDIELTYYIPSATTVSPATIEAAVEEKVNEYVTWQSAKLGRDINPSQLYSLLMSTGIKRLELVKPEFKKLKDGTVPEEGPIDPQETIPEVAKLKSKNIKNGGYEDE